jgi:hypothetical protein
MANPQVSVASSAICHTTSRWLNRFNHRGVFPGGRNGDGNSAVGVSGNMPAPMTGIPSFSATEKPAKAARPAQIRASQPEATPSVSCIQAATLSFPMRARTFAVAFRLILPDTTAAIPGCRAPRISPANVAWGTLSASARLSVPSAANSVTS